MERQQSNGRDSRQRRYLVSNERRTRRYCSFALVALLPAALWSDASENLTHVRHAYATEAIEANPKLPTTFAGLNWRLLGQDIALPPPQKSSESIEIAVHVQVDLTSPQAVQSLRECQVYLEDVSGRRWSPLPNRYLDTTCSKLSQASGQQAVFTEKFVVPTARASKVNLAIVMPTERPRYLRFPRPAL